MSTQTDAFFERQADYADLRLRAVQHVSGGGQSVRVAVETPEASLGEQTPVLTIMPRGGGRLPPELAEPMLWDDDFNAGLVGLGVRAESVDQEVERFAYGLRAELRKVTRFYGDGLFNRAVTDLLRENGFEDDPAVGPVLRQVPPFVRGRPPVENGRYAACRDMAAVTVSGWARQLTDQLGYSKPEAADIRTRALAHYLRTRFSIRSG